MALITKITDVHIVRNMAPMYVIGSDPIYTGNYLKAFVEIKFADKYNRITKELSGHYKFRTNLSSKELFVLNTEELGKLMSSEVLKSFESMNL